MGRGVREIQNKANKPYIIIAIVILYVWQILSFWTLQDLTNHYLECRQENVELRQKVLELQRDIQDPLGEIQSILKKLEYDKK